MATQRAAAAKVKRRKPFPLGLFALLADRSIRGDDHPQQRAAEGARSQVGRPAAGVNIADTHGDGRPYIWQPAWNANRQRQRSVQGHVPTIGLWDGTDQCSFGKVLMTLCHRTGMRGSMETGGLRYFTTTARYEHMGSAAAQLGVDESTVSRSIGRLEKRYGALFDRIGRRVKLNASGQVLLVHAERILEELDRAERAIDDLHGTETRPVRLGFLPSLGMHFVPELVTAFTRSNAGVQFQFTQTTREKLRVALMGGELDACIACCKFSDAAVAWEPLWDEEWQVFFPPAHELARRRIIEIGEIANEPILSFRTGERMRNEFEAFARRAGITPRIVWEAADIPTLLGLVNLGVGIAVLPESVRGNRGRAAALRLRGSYKRTVGISWLHGYAQSRNATAFRSFVVAHGSHRPGGVVTRRAGI